MASAAKSSQGVVLKRGTGTGTPETFEAIAEVTDISGPDESADRIEVTSMDSTEKEFIAGVLDGGEVKVEANATTDSALAGVYTDFKAGTLRNFQIVLPETGGWSFAAIVTAHSRKFGTNAKRSISFTLKISGGVSAI